MAEYDDDAKLHYTASPEKYTTRCWGYFQVSGQGPYFGQSGWFNYFHPERVQSAIDRYTKEARRVTEVIETHLAKQGTEYLVGDRVTYADLMWVPYYRTFSNIVPEGDISDLALVQAWLARLNARPAVVRVFEVLDEKLAKTMIGLEAKRAENFSV